MNAVPLNQAHPDQEDFLQRLRAALQSAPQPVQAWLAAQVEAILAQVPFHEALLKTSTSSRPETPSNRLLTPLEASKALNIPVRWIYRHTRQLPHRKIGRYTRFPERELLRWAERQQNRI